LQVYIYSLSENNIKTFLQATSFGSGFEPSSGFVQ